MGELPVADLRFWASFFRTLPALLLLLLLLGPEADGNQERLMISVRLSFCLSSYAGREGEKGREGGPEPPSAWVCHGPLSWDPHLSPPQPLCPLAPTHSPGYGT